VGRRSGEQIQRERAYAERKQTALELAAIVVDQSVPQEVRRDAAAILTWMADKENAR
jgi:uncharacterized protein (UPF0147 family)